ncbi:MAG: 30S ribosomal protein S7 [Bacteroidota bacterium]
MPRRTKIVKRPTITDPVVNNTVATRFIHCMMMRGKKSLSQRLFYGALDILAEKHGKPQSEIFNRAMKNVMPLVEVKPRRVGGATYQVPVEVKPERGQALAIRWLITNSRKRNGKSMLNKLADELNDAYNNSGPSVKKKEDTHKMAEANKAFAHYRW